jgi:hypothetical protein
MQQIVITHEGGVALSATKTLAIEPEKIVSTQSIGAACEFVYAETIDRRVSPKKYRAANTKSQVDSMITGTLIDFTVYNEADGSTYALTVQEKFIEDMQAGTLRIYGSTPSNQAGVSVRFVEGAWLEKKIFVDGSLGDFATGITTTTSTLAPTTTTTTAAVTTTTTTV